jgi:hypothetical protein
VPWASFWEMLCMARPAKRTWRGLWVSLRRPFRPLKRLSQQRATRRRYNSCNYWPGERSAGLEQPDNQLQAFFDNRKVGSAIWKWLHYFEIYERHFSRFRGKKSTLPRSEFSAVAALKCGAIISAPRRIFTAWTLSRTAKFMNATALQYSSATRLTGHSGENFAQRCRSLIS